MASRMLEIDFTETDIKDALLLGWMHITMGFKKPWGVVGDDIVTIV